MIVWRDSVCAGDDGDAPHEVILPVGGDSLRDVTDRLLAMRYLASISGGQGTWILQSGPHVDRPLAVLAQQWPQPRFLVAPETDVLAYVQPDAKPHLHLKYWCQADPDRVFDCLERGETLPDRYAF